MGNLELGSSSNLAICYINLGDLNMDRLVYVEYDELEFIWLEDEYAGESVYNWIEECVQDMLEKKE